MRMMFTALLLLSAGSVFAEESCDCTTYPFRPDKCVMECSAVTLTLILADHRSTEVLQGIGYSKEEVQAIAGTGGDQERIDKLLLKDAKIGIQLNIALQQLKEKSPSGEVAIATLPELKLKDDSIR